MAWKEVLVMEERCSFVLLAQKRHQSFTSLCKEYGISRKTGYKWVERYRKYGLKSLKEFSPSPDELSAQELCEDREAHFGGAAQAQDVGPKKLRDLLIKEHKIAKLSAESTIGEILKRNGVPFRKRLSLSGRRCLS